MRMVVQFWGKVDSRDKSYTEGNFRMGIAIAKIDGVRKSP